MCGSDYVGGVAYPLGLSPPCLCQPVTCQSKLDVPYFRYAGTWTDADIPSFLQILVFLLGFAISGCYRLQV